MRLKNCFLALALLSVLGCHCSHYEKDTKIIKVTESKVDSLDLSKIFEIKQVINIDTSACRLGQIVKVKCVGDNIYVWDNFGIHRFYENGKKVCHIGHKGRGPEEYLAVGDFDVNESTVAVLDMYKKVLLFDTDGNFKSSANLNFYAVGCLLTADRLILTSGYQEMTEKFHALRLADLTEVSAFGECKENEMTYRHFMQQQYFYRDVNGRILFHELMNNTVFLLTEDEFKPLYEFDLYGKTPPTEFWNQRFENVMDIVQKLENEGFCYGLPLYSVDGDIHFFTFTEKGEVKFAVVDSKRMRSMLAPKVYYNDIFSASTFPALQINMNSDRDISICVPSDKYCASISGDNPVIVRLNFRDKVAE